MRLALSALLALSFAASAACVPPQRDLTVAQIATVTSMEDLMQVQSTVADPQFLKIGKKGYTDADWASFQDAATRIAATSERSKELSKGPEFSKLATQLKVNADQLGAAAAAKSEANASTALAAMQATCKECHRRFK